MPNAGLTACRALDASAGEDECSAASVAPEQLNGLHRHLFRLPRADELHLVVRDGVWGNRFPWLRIIFWREGEIGPIVVVNGKRLTCGGFLVAIKCFAVF